MMPTRNFRGKYLGLNISILIYSIVPIYFIFDSLTIIVFDAGGLFTLIRGILGYVFIIYAYTRMHISRKDIFIFLFLLQTLILLPNSNNLYTSINIASKVFVSLFMFPIGFYFVRNEERFQRLISSIPILLAIIIFNFILGRFFEVGYDVYDKDNSLRLGNFSDNVNVFTYTLLITPLYFINSRGKFSKVSVIILSALVSIIILLAMKRVAILGVIIGFFIFTLFTGKIFKNVKWISIVLILLYLLLPFYQNLLTKRYYAREDELQLESIQEEGRVWEIELIWTEILSFKDPFKSIFGDQTFNSPNNYAGGIYVGRRLHVDYNEIVYGNGLLGLIIYFGIYYSIARLYFKYSLKTKQTNYSILKGVFWALFLTSLFTSFSGQYYGITFRTIIFLFLGAILRQFYNIRKITSIQKDQAILPKTVG